VVAARSGIRAVRKVVKQLLVEMLQCRQLYAHANVIEEQYAGYHHSYPFVPYGCMQFLAFYNVLWHYFGSFLY
jgi:hypothetical protein